MEGESLVVSHEAPGLDQPSKGSLYDPAFGQDFESFDIIAALHDLEPYFEMTNDGGDPGLFERIEVPSIEHAHLPVNHENFLLLALEFGILALDIIFDLVWLDFALIEDAPDRGFRGPLQTIIPLFGSHGPDMFGQGLDGPKFGRITNLLGLGAGEIDDPDLGLGCDGRLEGPVVFVIQSGHGNHREGALHPLVEAITGDPFLGCDLGDRLPLAVAEKDLCPSHPAKRLAEGTSDSLQFNTLSGNQDKGRTFGATGHPEHLTNSDFLLKTM